MSKFLAYHRHRCERFKGGGIQFAYHIWEGLTSDDTILDTVSGMSIEPQNVEVTKMHAFVPKDEHDIMSTEIQKLLQKDVIRLSAPEQGEIISPIFLREKQNGKFRLILNLKKFNQNVDKIHFKMDTLQSALDIISHGDFLTKIDISDAYYSVPINPEHRKYLKFKFDDVLYEYAVLPNGYRDGPRRFTKLLKPPLSVLRHLQLIITAYIDDLLHVNRSMEQCKVGALVIVSLLSSLGFTINPDKCVLQPSQKIEYLGFIINTVDMTVTLTPEKIRALIDYCKWALDVDSMSIRCLAKLLGKITSSFNGVQYGPLHFRVLEHLKTEALENNKYDYEKTVHLSSEARKEIVWWIKNLPTSFNRVRRPNPSIVIATDACGYGWGECCYKMWQVSTSRTLE